MSIEIFQKVVEETSQKTLQQIILKQKLIMRIFDPTPIQSFSRKSSFSKYIDKNQQQLILTIEDEYFAKISRKVIEKIFPYGWHFQPQDP